MLPKLLRQTFFSKKSFLLLLKLFIAIILVYWMIAKGKLDLSSCTLLIENPTILVFGLSIWFTATVLSNSLRWRLLVKAIGVPLKVWSTVKISLTGLFFSNFLPGAVGGDLIKAIYIYRLLPKDSSLQGKTTAMLTILLDRILGLASLFLMAFPLFLLKKDLLEESPLFATLALITAGGALCTGLFLIGLLIPWKNGKDPIRFLLSFKFYGFSFLLKIYEGLRWYQKTPKIILKGLLFSMGSQSLLIFLLYVVTKHLFQITTLTPFDIALIMPIGCLLTALPLSPGGIGVGHVAFQTLFELLGVTQGANIYNAYFLLVTLPNLLGVIPYLLGANRSSMEDS